MDTEQLDAKLWLGARRLRAQAKALSVTGALLVILAFLGVAWFDPIIALLEMSPLVGAAFVCALFLGTVVVWWRAFTKAALAADISASLDA